MNDSHISFTAVLLDGSLKEYKSGEDIRAYYDRAELYRVFLQAPGGSQAVNLDTIYSK